MSAKQDRAVLEMLGQKYSPEMLEACTEPVTAQELIESLDIPPATCYRRLEQLTTVGLLEKQGGNHEGENRGIAVYQRPVDEVSFNFENKLSTATESPSPVKRKLDRLVAAILNWE